MRSELSSKKKDLAYPTKSRDVQEKEQRKRNAKKRASKNKNPTSIKDGLKKIEKWNKRMEKEKNPSQGKERSVV